MTKLHLIAESPATNIPAPRNRRILSTTTMPNTTSKAHLHKPCLQVRILFEPRRDSLSDSAHASLLLLAELLLDYPCLLARLEGHTDGRGTDEYNNVLSDYRARSVEACLLKAGIESGRIERSACGASRAQARPDDTHGQALERRVTLEIYQADPPLHH